MREKAFAQLAPNMLALACIPLAFSATTPAVARIPFAPRAVAPRLLEQQLEEKTKAVAVSNTLAEEQLVGGDGTFSYADFAQSQPFANNILIATAKTAAADLLAQTVIGGASLDAVDWERSLLFMGFGAIYLGGFQYLYQVNVFKRMFDIDSFTNKPWADKLRDGPGLQALAAQTALDLTVLTLICKAPNRARSDQRPARLRTGYES